jgi:hypothetical protein
MNTLQPTIAASQRRRRNLQFLNMYLAQTFRYKSEDVVFEMV